MNKTSSNTDSSDDDDVEINDECEIVETNDQKEFLSLVKRLSNLKISINNDLQEHECVLELLLNYLTKHFDSLTYYYIINRCLGKLVNYSHETIIVPCLIKTNYPKALLEWLSLVSNKEDSENFEDIVTIIYNISRHDDGIQVLNSLNAATKIKEMQMHNKDPEINIMYSMIIALLSTSEQIKNDRKRMNNILDELLQIVVDTSKRSHGYTSNGWHISEPLITLVKLICYDRTLDYILQHIQVELETSSTIEFFIKLLLKFYKNISVEDPLKLLTSTALCNILWSISLRPQYKQELQENKEFKILIEKIATDEFIMNSTQYVPRYIENIQKATDGILCNINDNIKTNIPNTAVVVPSMLIYKKPSIMISYAHRDNDVCMQLHNELDKYNQQFDIWIDWKNSKTGYVWSKIADGIADSSLIICLLSNKYYESKSCQQEFVYAHDHLKKTVIPVYISNDKQPGWLAIHVCIMKYVRFGNRNPLEREKLNELVEMVQENLSEIHGKNKEDLSLPVTTVTHHEPMPVVQETKEIDLSQKSVEQWDTRDIEQWFQENKICMNLCKLYNFENGTQLLNYASTFSNDDKIELQRQIYYDAFAEKYKGKRLLPHQFITFAYALRKLISQQVVNNEIKQTADHSTTQLSAKVNYLQMCIIL